LGNPTGNLPWAATELEWVTGHLQERDVTVRPFKEAEAKTDRMFQWAPVSGVIHCAAHSGLDAVDFLRSGIELADRRLTVMDVTARLELKEALLVYLSSCDSAQARPGRTDELMALVRAFFYAGTPSALATLWAVRDGPAATFADLFYSYWLKQRLPLATAYQAAMVVTRQEHFSDPLDWAPFVLMGAWR
jgi:CHAT domain-containing protein